MILLISHQCLCKVQLQLTYYNKILKPKLQRVVTLKNSHFLNRTTKKYFILFFSDLQAKLPKMKYVYITLCSHLTLLLKRISTNHITTKVKCFYDKSTFVHLSLRKWISLQFSIIKTLYYHRVYSVLTGALLLCWQAESILLFFIDYLPPHSLSKCYMLLLFCFIFACFVIYLLYLSRYKL